MELNYRQFLDSELIRHPLRDDATTIEILSEAMQSRYPGEYTLDWRFDQKWLRFRLVPIFEDKNKETMWMLKYS
jgi:hypothetical protein